MDRVIVSALPVQGADYQSRASRASRPFQRERAVWRADEESSLLDSAQVPSCPLCSRPGPERCEVVVWSGLSGCRRMYGVSGRHWRRRTRDQGRGCISERAARDLFASNSPLLAVQTRFNHVKAARACAVGEARISRAAAAEARARFSAQEDAGTSHRRKSMEVEDAQQKLLNQRSDLRQAQAATVRPRPGREEWVAWPRPTHTHKQTNKPKHTRTGRGPRIFLSC